MSDGALIGNGINSTITSVTIDSGSTVSYQKTVISLGSGTSTQNNTINISGNVIGGGTNQGPNGTGGNAVEFGNNTTLTIDSGASIEVISNGTENSEAINPTGYGNTIINNGTIKTDNDSASAMWMQGTDNSVASNGINTIINNGLIQAGSSGTGAVIGNSNSGIVHFINNSGAVVNGNISLGSTGNLANVVTLENGSTVNGTVSGGGNAATLNLQGDSGSDTLSKTVSGFGTLNKSGAGTWTVGAADAPLDNLSDALKVNVGRNSDGSIATDGGTLILAGNVTSKNATVGIDNGTLQLGTGGTSGWIDGITHNNGVLAFNRSDTNTLSSNIDGTGQVEQIGSGTTILTGTNTYSGATNITNGTLQIGDGTKSGSIADTSNINNNGIFVINNPEDTTISQVISGTGAVTQQGTGTTTLTGTNTYTGLTTINNGNLQIGNGNTDGSIATTSAIVDNTNLIVNNTGNTNFSQVISGTGNIAQQGSGTTNLSNVNSYTGSTIVNNGTLALTESGDISSSSGVHAYGGTFDISNLPSSTTQATIQALDGLGAVALGSKTLVISNANNNFGNNFSGSIAGSGGLEITNGTEILTGENNYTGTTTIGDSAVLQLGAEGTTGTINSSSNVIDNGSLVVNHSDNINLTNSITGSGNLVQNGIGTITLGDTNTYSGGTFIESGKVVGSATSFGSGSINNQAALVFNQNSDATFNNGINGTGTLEKTGKGTLTLDGENEFSGSTTITQGELAVNGSLRPSIVTAESGTVLSGIGTVGGVVAQTGSTIRPGGNSVGTLNVAGDYQQNSGSTYAVQVVPGTNTSDLISITGAATLNSGAILSVSKSQPGNYTLDTKYRVLTAEGGVSGTYALTGDTAVSAFYALDTTYDANNVYLEVFQKNSFTDQADTRNQTETANGLDSLPNDSVVKNTVGSLPTGDQARQAFDSLSGEIHASARTALLQDSFYIRDAAIERLRSADCGTAADSGTIKVHNLRKRRGAEGACEGAGPALWMQAYGSWGHNQGNGNAASMDHSTGGFVMGADTPVRNTNWHVGGLLGYGYSSFNVAGRSSSGHSNNLTAGLYGGTHWGRLGFRMGATYTWNMLATSRNVRFAGFADKLNSRYDGGTAQAFGDLGYRFDIGNTALEPFANVAYANIHTDRYREHGGAAALRGSAMDTGVTYSTFGLRLASTFKSGTTLLIPNMTVGYRHAFGEVVPTTNQRFVAGGNDFSVAGVPLSENSALVNVGLKAKVTDNITAGVSYIGQYGDGYLDSGLRGTFSWVF
ncbi:autotransporter domain-containing protein [Acetobacter orientalis]|uniref:autotransporter outer membrane beta-barrel domain-containing protein n=1 Tax=Acetobacter orientalis TaxID=146474 RepID=UPI0039E7884B